MSAEAISLSEQHGFQLFVAGATLLHGWSRAGTPTAVDEVEAGVATTVDSGNQTFAPLILGGVAEVYEAVGRHDQALATVDAGLALSAQYGMTFWDAELQRQRGELFLLMEGHDRVEAERLFESALGISRQQQAKALELRAAMSLARIWRQQGKVAQARDLLAPVYASFTEGFGTHDLRRAKGFLDELALKSPPG